MIYLKYLALTFFFFSCTPKEKGFRNYGASSSGLVNNSNYTSLPPMNPVNFSAPSLLIEEFTDLFGNRKANVRIHFNDSLGMEIPDHIKIVACPIELDDSTKMSFEKNSFYCTRGLYTALDLVPTEPGLQTGSLIPGLSSGNWKISVAACLDKERSLNPTQLCGSDNYKYFHQKPSFNDYPLQQRQLLETIDDFESLATQLSNNLNIYTGAAKECADIKYDRYKILPKDFSDYFRTLSSYEKTIALADSSIMLIPHTNTTGAKSVVIIMDDFTFYSSFVEDPAQMSKDLYTSSKITEDEDEDEAEDEDEEEDEDEDKSEEGSTEDNKEELAIGGVLLTATGISGIAAFKGGISQFFKANVGLVKLTKLQKEIVNSAEEIFKNVKKNGKPANYSRDGIGNSDFVKEDLLKLFELSSQSTNEADFKKNLKKDPKFKNAIDETSIPALWKSIGKSKTDIAENAKYLEVKKGATKLDEVNKLLKGDFGIKDDTLTKLIQKGVDQLPFKKESGMKGDLQGKRLAAIGVFVIGVGFAGAAGVIGSEASESIEDILKDEGGLEGLLLTGESNYCSSLQQSIQSILELSEKITSLQINENCCIKEFLTTLYKLPL